MSSAVKIYQEKTIEAMGHMERKVKKELIDGIWYMSPTAGIYHGIVVGNLQKIFGPKLWGRGCLTFSENLEVYYNNDNNYVIPDFAIVCNRNFFKDRGVDTAPDFVVEVLSPTSAKRDKTIKKAKYEMLGVKEFWLISVGDRSVEVYLLVDVKYELANVYAVPYDWQIERMDEAELAEIVYIFNMSVFDGLEVDVRDVFENLE